MACPKCNNGPHYVCDKGEYHLIGTNHWETTDGKYRFNYDTSEWEQTAVNQTAVNQTAESKNSMLFNIAVTTRPIVQATTNQVVMPERIIIPTELVLAPEQLAAVLAIGVKYAKKFDGEDMSNLVVHVRQNV